MKLTHIFNPSPEDVPDTCQGLLLSLGGPTVFHLDGTEDGPPRVIVTLQHGNEPSGLWALQRLLKEGFKPRRACKIVVASVVAASTEPLFSFRMLDGQRDLNRCYHFDQEDPQGKLASSLYREIQSWQPEAIIDLHNTSGSGPAFSVATHSSAGHTALASHFCSRLIHTDIRLGSLMEKDFGCPIVTIEAGGAQDAEAHQNAYHGMQSLLSAQQVFRLQREVELLSHPFRLELSSPLRIAYGEAITPDFDIVMRQDIERLNFGTTAAGEVLGWMDNTSAQQLRLDPAHTDPFEFFTLSDGILYTRLALKMFMVTTNPNVATSDCLFYFVPA